MADLITVSESWSRDNLPLEELLELDDYKIITNVKQRDFRGGKPAIIVNQKKYHVKPLCPDPLTVPLGVECVWALLTPKNTTPQSKVNILLLLQYITEDQSQQRRKNSLITSLPVFTFFRPNMVQIFTL